MTPTEIITAHQAEIFSGRGSDGRVIEVRRVGALDRLRLFKALGPDLSQNEPYLGMALLASAVRSIDGVPVPPPVTESQVEALVVRLGDDGLELAARLLEGAAEALARDQVGN